LGQRLDERRRVPVPLTEQLAHRLTLSCRELLPMAPPIRGNEPRFDNAVFNRTMMAARVELDEKSAHKCTLSVNPLFAKNLD